MKLELSKIIQRSDRTLFVIEAINDELPSKSNAALNLTQMPVRKYDHRMGTLEELECAHITHVLKETRTLEEAAEILGINLSTLWRKRRHYGLE